MVLGRIGATSSPYGAMYKIVKVILPHLYLSEVMVIYVFC